MVETQTPWGLTFAEVAVEEIKICSRCNSAKDAQTDFYICKGKRRSECKKCTIKKNVRYQKRVESWKHRFVDNDEKRSYMADYYIKHKEKFIEYRRKFKERHPDYYKEYFRNRKNQTS